MRISSLSLYSGIMDILKVVTEPVTVASTPTNKPQDNQLAPMLQEMERREELKTSEGKRRV